MNTAHRFLVIPVTQRELADVLCAGIAGEPGAGMWGMELCTAALDPLAAPVTHVASHGLIQQQFADMLASPQAVHDAAAALGLAYQGAPITLAQVQALLAAADVSDEHWMAACARLALQPKQRALP